MANGVSNPNELQPKANEWLISVEEELMPNLAVRLTGLYAKNFNNYALQNNLRPYSAYNIPLTR